MDEDPVAPVSRSRPKGDPEGDGKTAEERLRQLERRLWETERNLVAQQALLDRRLLRVETNRLFSSWNAVVIGWRNVRRLVQASLARSPFGALLPAQSDTERRVLEARYARWAAREESRLPSTEEALAQSKTWHWQPNISVLAAVEAGANFGATLKSVRAQVYENWELCLGVDERCAAQVLPLLCDVPPASPRIRHTVLREFDPVTALNEAAGLASGDYLSFIGEGTVLSPFALFYVAEALQTAAHDLLYADEDAAGDRSGRRMPAFKPDWSPDLLTTCMYLGDGITMGREVFEQHRGLRAPYAGAHLHDLALRVTEAGARVHHIHRVLYHAPSRLQISPSTTAARAIEEAVTRREGVRAECTPSPGGPGFFVRRETTPGDTAAIICSRSARLVESCLRSIGATAAHDITQVIVVAHEPEGPDPELRRAIVQAGAENVPFRGAFNFAAMNNLGAAAAEKRNLLFLNDDVEATAPGWAAMLSEQIARPEIGIAGAVLRYPSGLLQHAGIVTGIHDGIGHPGRFSSSNLLWPWLLMTRDVSAVTGACLGIRKDCFQEVGGFDTAFPNNYNDADLCFRIRARGLRVICVPVPGLIHRECQTRRGVVRFEERYLFYQRWGHVLAETDPYYSPSLARTEAIALNLEPVG